MIAARFRSRHSRRAPGEGSSIGWFFLAAPMELGEASGLRRDRHGGDAMVLWLCKVMP